MKYRRESTDVVVESPAMAEKQMIALERFITESKDATWFAKRAIIFLLRCTEKLTKPVSLTILRQPFASQMQDGAHDMISSLRPTRLDLFFQGIGTEFGLSHHCGSYSNGEFNANGEGTTIWISHTGYDHRAGNLVGNDIELISGIQLPADL